MGGRNLADVGPATHECHQASGGGGEPGPRRRAGRCRADRDGRQTFSFPAKTKGGPDLVVNLGPAQFDVQVVTWQQNGKTLAFLVREPVGNARILGTLPDEPCPDLAAVGATSM